MKIFVPLCIAATLLAAGPALRAEHAALDRPEADQGALTRQSSQDESASVGTETAAGQEAQAAEDNARAAAERAQELAEQAQEQAAQAQKRAKEIQKKVIAITGSDKPRLGIILQIEADPDTDVLGAVIQGVTPGGPADQAGLKADDIITKFNGQSLAATKVSEDDEESMPAQKLLELAWKLKDGDKATLEFKRDKETKTAVVTAKALADKQIRVFVNTDMPDVPDVGDIDIPNFSWHGGNGSYEFALNDESPDIELVPLNADLGDYFGASEGLLVVRAPADSALKVKGGDVILKIGDRKPATASQALRILRSYEPGESLSIDVLRKRQKVTLTSTVPQEKEKKRIEKRIIRRVPEAPEAPAPPKAPTAPMPAPAPPAHST